MTIVVPHAMAQDEQYLFELGALAGGSYYVGDAADYVFMNLRPAFGGYARYKFNRRWNFSLKGLYTDMKLKYADYQCVNQFVNLDVVAEYNFLPYGSAKYDTKVKPYTPFMYLGVGASLYSGWKSVGAYIPFGIGFKWNFAKHGHLSLMWQHQLYFADNLENVDDLNNANQLNGWDLLNNDWMSTFVVSLSVDFGTRSKTCHVCGKEGQYMF